MIRRDYKDFISLAGLKKYISISTMTVKEIAEKAGIEINLLKSLINGVTFTRTDNLAKLAYALNCDIDDILEFKGIIYKPGMQKYSKSPSLNIKCELSYQPLYEMFYDIYGVQYKKKLDEIFPKLRPVFQHKVQEERTIANKADDSQNGKACRLKIENEKPLTLPVVYEICRQLKCTPGCVFGYKGEYEEEKKPVNLEPENLTTIYFDNNTKHVDVKIHKLGKMHYWTKEKLLTVEDKKEKLLELGCLVIYDELADMLHDPEADLNTFPKQISLYPLEKIDESKEAPFYVNGGWRKTIQNTIRLDLIEYWQRYYEKGWYVENHEWFVDKSTGRRVFENGEFKRHWVPTHFELITLKGLFHGCGRNRLDNKKDSYDYVKKASLENKKIELLSKLDNCYESISHISYEEEKSNYKAS